MDLVFIIDGSTSVGLDDFKLSLNFIISIVNQFPVTPLGVHVGVIVVQPSNQVVIELGLYKEKFTVNGAIRQIPYPNGDNSVGAALLKAKELFANGKRQVPKVLVVLLDNKAADDLTKPTIELQKIGVGVVPVGGSGDVDQTQLNAITASPENVVTTGSYGNLISIVGTVISKINNRKLSSWLISRSRFYSKRRKMAF